MATRSKKNYWIAPIIIVLIIGTTEGIIKKFPAPEAQAELKRYDDLSQKFIIFHRSLPRDKNWLYLSAGFGTDITKQPISIKRLFGTDSKKTMLIKKELVKYYKIHLMPKPEYMVETATRLMKYMTKDPVFNQHITEFKMQLLPYTGAHITDQQLAPFIVIYVAPDASKDVIKKVLKELVDLFADIPQLELTDLTPEQASLLKDTSNLCPRFNTPAIPGSHFICYAQGEGIEKEVKGFLLSKQPISEEKLYQNVSFSTFMDIDIPCRDPFIAKLAEYNYCTELPTTSYDRIKEKMLEKNAATELLETKPSLLVLFFNKMPPDRLSSGFLAEQIKPDASNLKTGTQIKDLLQKKITEIKQLPEIEYQKLYNESERETKKILATLHDTQTIIGPISVAEIFFNKNDNFALYPSDFTGISDDYHLL